MIGVWNLLSNEAVQASISSPSPEVTPPQADAPGENPLQAAIPTLVPLVDLSTVSSVNVASSVQVSSPVSQTVLPLRSAAIPTQVIVQKNKPVIEQPVQVLASGGGGGGSAPAPVTSTHSSHP
jgi:hypothetical protein